MVGNGSARQHGPELAMTCLNVTLRDGIGQSRNSLIWLPFVLFDSSFELAVVGKGSARQHGPKVAMTCLNERASLRLAGCCRTYRCQTDVCFSEAGTISQGSLLISDELCERCYAKVLVSAV